MGTSGKSDLGYVLIPFHNSADSSLLSYKIKVKNIKQSPDHVHKNQMNTINQIVEMADFRQV